MWIDEWANQSYTRLKKKFALNCFLHLIMPKTWNFSHSAKKIALSPRLQPPVWPQIIYQLRQSFGSLLELVSGFYIRPLVNISLSLEGTDTAQTLELGHDGYSLTLKMRLVPMIYGIIVEWAWDMCLLWSWCPWHTYRNIQGGGGGVTLTPTVWGFQTAHYSQAAVCLTFMSKMIFISHVW